MSDSKKARGSRQQSYQQQPCEDGLAGDSTSSHPITRRDFVEVAASTVAVAGLSQLLPSLALADEVEAEGWSEAEEETEMEIGTEAKTEIKSEGDEAASEEANVEELGEVKDTLEPLATAAPIGEGVYLIRSALSLTQVLDIAGGSQKSQANVQLYHSNMTGAQSFALSYDKNNYATFTNTQSKMVLDVARAQKRSGTKVWQYAPNNTLAQKWVIEAAQNGEGYVIRSALSKNLVLDVSGARTADGTTIQVYTRNNTPAQTFFFIDLASTYVPQKSVALASGDYVITSALRGSPAVDVPGASRLAGLQLQLYAPNGSFAQIFRVVPSGAWYVMRSLTSGKALTVLGNNRVATTPVVQESYSSTLLSQKWALENNGDGTVTFISASCGLALDAAGGQSANGTHLQLYSPNSTPAQRFRIASAPAQIIPDGAIISLAPYSASNKRVDISGASRQSGAAVQIYASNSTPAQKFQVTQQSDNVYSLAALCSGQLLSAEGSTLRQRPKGSSGPSAAQLWRVERALGGIVLTNQGSNQKLALSESALVTAATAKSTSQCFGFEIVPAIEVGTYVFITKNGFALDISGGSTSEGANVQLYTPNNTNAQKFKVEVASSGAFSIKNCRSEKAVSVKDSSATNKVNVLQQSYKAQAGQHFMLVPTGDGYFHVRTALSPVTWLGADSNISGSNVYSTTDITRALSFSYQQTTYTKADKWIAITFDDGPGSYTGHLLDELKKRDVHATFFVVGQAAQGKAGEDLLRRMSNEGHEIGNHTWAHNGSAGALMAGLQATDDLVRRVIGKVPVLMRPPGGAVNAQTRSCGKPIILWSIDPRDWESRNTTAIYNHVVDRAGSGDIVLLHDIHSATIPAALNIIDTLKARGYAFATVSQLLGSPRANTVYYSGPATVGTL
jgi:peptidoglycan/xylan/chitin deacetylase (PgdA/CDA1 family)